MSCLEFGIQYNIAKADRTDRKVQNPASYINEDTLNISLSLQLDFEYVNFVITDYEKD